METLSIGRFVLVALAVWRVTHLLAEEDGPGDVVVRLRKRLGNSLAGQAMDCFFCLSLWIAAPFAVLLAGDVLTWGLTWLALSGAACLLQRATESHRSTDLQDPKTHEPSDLTISARSHSDVLRSKAAGVADPGLPGTNTASTADDTKSDATYVPGRSHFRH
jgi:hypothetical protein